MSKEVSEMNLDNRRAEQMQRDLSTLSTLSDVGLDKQLSRRETSMALGRGFSRQVRSYYPSFKQIVLKELAKLYYYTLPMRVSSYNC